MSIWFNVGPDTPSRSTGQHATTTTTAAAAPAGVHYVIHCTNAARIASGPRSVVVSPALWKLRIVPYLSSTRDMQTMAR
jgi:hypothetical protein